MCPGEFLPTQSAVPLQGTYVVYKRHSKTIAAGTKLSVLIKPGKTQV